MPRNRTDDEDPPVERSRSAEEKKGFLTNVIGGTLIAGCCWSLGFGYSQSTLGAVVARTNLSIEYLKEVQNSDRKAAEDALARISKDIVDQRLQALENMKQVVGLMSKMTEQNQELIAFLRARSNVAIDRSSK